MSGEPASGGSTEYINHHLQHLQVSVGDSAFMTLNVDTLFFTAVLSVLFVAGFVATARRATGTTTASETEAAATAHSVRLFEMIATVSARSTPVSARPPRKSSVRRPKSA